MSELCHAEPLPAVHSQMHLVTLTNRTITYATVNLEAWIKSKVQSFGQVWAGWGLEHDVVQSCPCRGT